MLFTLKPLSIKTIKGDNRGYFAYKDHFLVKR